MDELLIYDDEYYYFIHGVSIDKFYGVYRDFDKNSSDLKATELISSYYFSDGLPTVSEDINYTALLLNGLENNPVDILNTLSNYQYKSNFADRGLCNVLIKIPKDYLNMHNIEKSFPIFNGTSKISSLGLKYNRSVDLGIEMPLEYFRLSYLDSHFILGCYCLKESIFIKNENYQVVFDPTGMLLAKPPVNFVSNGCLSQLDYSKEYEIYYKSRLEMFQTGNLEQYDKDNHVFDKLVLAYKRKYHE